MYLSIYLYIYIYLFMYVFVYLYLVETGNIHEKDIFFGVDNGKIGGNVGSRNRNQTSLAGA